MNKEQIGSWIKRVLEIRSRYASFIVDPNPQSFVVMHDHSEHVLAFARICEKPWTRVGVVTNTDFHAAQSITLKLDTAKKDVRDLLGGKKCKVKDAHLHIMLEPGECLVFEY
ncbi:MAG: alpha-glucosidase C-terminal domain-containing protein [Ignavibacteriae bacterium]|nr:alpha-glucosidase C-terminal domain-containing protein [Ignavibacteriota bacterium]